MLNSATLILEQYINDAHWFKFRWFEQIRVDVEEFIYICEVNSRWFVVYETDYLVADLPKVADEIAHIIKERDLTLIHWLAKKVHHSTAKSLPLDTKTEDNDNLRKVLVYKDPETSLRYAVLEVKGPSHPIRQYNPSTYGSFKL